MANKQEKAYYSLRTEIYKRFEVENEWEASTLVKYISFSYKDDIYVVGVNCVGTIYLSANVDGCLQGIYFGHLITEAKNKLLQIRKEQK